MFAKQQPYLSAFPCSLQRVVSRSGKGNGRHAQSAVSQWQPLLEVLKGLWVKLTLSRALG